MQPSEAPQKELRRWQALALEKWKECDRKGIVAVVTGAGKTVFALECLKNFRQNVPAATALIVVPTNALLDQWVEEIMAFFDLPMQQIVVLTSKRKIAQTRINIGVINTVAAVAQKPTTFPVFLIVDECHKAATPKFSEIFKIRRSASLGLSATPERQYDDGLSDVLIPNLGPILIEYGYEEALRDKVIVPFELRNVLFHFDAEDQDKYDKLSRSIGISIEKEGVDSPKTIALLIRRNRLSNLSLARLQIAAKIVSLHKNQKILIFHEDIAACELLFQILHQNGIAVGKYHSQMSFGDRIKTLNAYRKGQLSVLVSCKSLDEGYNVPETQVGIIAASTATYRQRIQRLGRVLRPSKGKDNAIVYSIVAAEPEIQRLLSEAKQWEGITKVTWSKP